MSNPYATPDSDIERPDPELGALVDVPAGRGVRFAAAAADLLFLGFLVGAVIFDAMLLDPFFMGDDLSGADEFGFSFLPTSTNIALVALVIFTLLNGYLIFTRGQTIGKAMGKIRVLDESGETVSGTHYLLVRTLPVFVALMIPFVGIVIYLIDAAFVFSEDGRCLHDRLAGTKVTEKARLSADAHPVHGHDRG